jgi:iron(III) transport system substrate-binding protein
MMRTVLIPTTSQQPSIATRFAGHLIQAAWDESSSTADYPFPTISRDPSASDASLRPIRMGPGLLVYLSKLKNRHFITEWENAILQP